MRIEHIMSLCDGQPPEVINAVIELESRGLSFCGHFGYQNALALLHEMDEAFDSGLLYEFLRDRFGILTQPLGQVKP